MLKEGVFRKPRLKTNKVLLKYARFFSGNIINVSASNDMDKNCSFQDYYFGDYNNGQRYKEYFVNADSYTITNYPNDETKIDLDEASSFSLDLEDNLDKKLVGKYDVVFNHTVLEHVFDVFKAFENLCKLSKDIVILIVPQFQQIHDYQKGYKDYWRFTPFAIDKLFEKYNMRVLVRETTHGFSESMYLFYIATKDSDKWNCKFSNVLPCEEYVSMKIDGSNYTLFSNLILKFDNLVRKITKIF
jgi:hypothetical protein